MESQKIQIAPSILSADLLRLEEQVKALSENGADFIHVDVMDGHFVPNLTFGPNMVKALKRITSVPLDVHLMISNPDAYIEVYARAGADILTVHQEACTHLHRTIQNIHNQGIKAGVSLNPATSLSTIENVLDDLDLLLIMTVNPGFGGQKFIPQGLRKIAEARKMINASGRDILLEVDGGVDLQTVESIVQSGAKVLVSGSAVFGQPDIVKAMQELKAKAEKA
ncbi:ribulose-phosphate 3-epimerase [Candidatus Sulfidibacterium hydrothermale]|uniref:ribulose-phosphate 3-epimerase n=1 Tax=Candidatus Sulfidibacterium hydrothermale TaxID=2875962 RepID=UPI001F0A8153|nr:ribulose-phosphate 3-epimerase [Candidatus Sulfidibacterium hydrothermale]UBM63182.1 ribulose-phosphate 3-epimerase [Candidatus Sulfidibacterium hydrothermale]